MPLYGVKLRRIFSSSINMSIDIVPDPWRRHLRPPFTSPVQPKRPVRPQPPGLRVEAGLRPLQRPPPPRELKAEADRQRQLLRGQGV